MRRGDFAAAWEQSDAFLREHREESCWHLPRHEQWIWRGEPLKGKRVLIRCYRGYGDIIQFLRYVPMVQAIAKSVTLWMPEALIPFANAPAVPLHEGAFEGEYDVDVELMELPYVFRSTLETIPREVPYIRVLGPRASVLGGTVGLCVQSGDWDPRRDVPEELFADLQVVDLRAIRPPLALAEAMVEMDLIISVDTFAAHLAGALGRPVWVLLHSDPDWRWMLGRDDSPWYPTMRLFRQESAGEWERVVARVRAAASAAARREWPSRG
jgi:hypothetical protein